MTIKENYQKILSNIDEACKKANRSPEEITVLAVCKSQPVEKISQAIDAGIIYLGENKSQEALTHMKELLDRKVKWHYIGKLQKNKINKIVQTFDFIQSVDGIKALEHIQKRVDDEIEVFIEINIADEKTKSGFTPEGLKKALNYISNLNKIKITGFMSLPPFHRDPDDVRPYFIQLRKLQDEINAMNLDCFDIKHLSMGMSNDYIVAIEEGATIIRVGTALFGSRFQ